MKSKINRELIPVLEDVFVTEGIVDTFKGLAEKHSLRLAERYIKGSILTVNKNIEKNAYVSGIDKSKGDITKVPTYKDYKTIERKLNLMLEDDNSPKKFKKIMADVNKLSAFLYDNRNGILKQVYTGKHKSRTGQLVYISMVVSLFYTALGLINKYGTETYDNDKKLNKESTMLIKVFASKATVNDFTNLVKHLPEFEKETLTEDVVDAETGEEIKDEDDTTEDDDLDSIEDIEDDGLNLTLDDISTPEDLAKALEDGKDDFLKLANEILLVQSRLGKIRTVEVKTLKLDEDTKNKMKFSNSLRTDTYISAETLESVGFNKPEEVIKNEIPEHYDQTIVLFVTYKSGSVAFATFDATKAYMDKLEDLKQFIFNTTSLYIKKLSKIRKYAVVESVNMRFYRKEQLTSAILKEKLQESFFDEMKEIKAKANEIEDGKFEEAWDVNNKDEQMHPLAYNAAHEILVPQREFGEFLGFELKLASGADFGKIAKDVDGFIAENHKELSDNTILYADAKYTHKASFPIRLWIFAPQENVSLDVCEEVVGDKVKWFINYLTQQNLKEVNDGAVNQYPVAESVTFETILSEDFVVKQPLQESGILGNSTTWDQNKKQKSIDRAAKRIVKAQKRLGRIKGLNVKVLDPGKTRKMMLGKSVGNAVLFSLAAAGAVAGERKYRDNKYFNPSYTVHNPDGTKTKQRAREYNADGTEARAAVNRKLAAGAGAAAAAATLATSGIMTKKRGVVIEVKYENDTRDVFLGLASEEQLQAGVHKEVFRALSQAVSRFKNLNEDALLDEEFLNEDTTPLQESGILGNSTTWDQNKKQKSIDRAAKRIVKAQKRLGRIKGLNVKVLDPGKTRKMMLGKSVGNAVLFSLAAAGAVAGERKYRDNKYFNPSYTVHNPDGTKTKQRAREYNADGTEARAAVNRKLAAGAGAAAAAATLATSGIMTKKRGVVIEVKYENDTRDVFLGLASEEQLQAGVHKEVFRALTQAVSRFRNLNEDALSDEEELANNPEAPRFPEKTTPVKELTEGTIYSLIGEDEEFLDEDTTLTEDSLKDFILGGVSKTGKNIAKGVNTTKSVNIKAFFNNNYAKGIAVVGSLIALLFMTRYIITLVCMMRVNIAQYLRETASIIDEQIDAVNNMDTRTKQEEISAKLKNIANKFDLDTSVASNKAERANRDFDTELLDNFTDEELANDNGEENFNGGAFF